VDNPRFDLAAAMAAAARRMRTPDLMEEGLQQIAEAAARSIPHFGHAGISLLTRGGREVTKAATDELVWKLDTLQYDLEEGPCVDAMHGPRVVAAPHMASQKRWPNYTPEAVKLGLRSQLAVKLYLDDQGTLGGLNLYSTAADDIDVEAEHMAELFAAHAAIALGSVVERDQLNQALESRRVIGMALGLLMERYAIGDDRAFEFLVRTSSHSNVKMRDVAQEIVRDSQQRGAGNRSRLGEPEHPPEPRSERMWVDIDSPQEVVATGLRRALETGLGPSLFVTVGPVDGEPDVILYDVISLQTGDVSELARLQQETGSLVIAVSYDGLRPDLEALAMDHGAAAVIPLSISVDQLAEVIHAAIEGTLDDVPTVRTLHDGSYPGRTLGLSRRESTVLTLIVQGLSNQEIATQCFLSVNSVKTYIRSAYRKIGVKSRAQAVAWGLQHGFTPPPFD
jgi:DNA-binding NarL/FixJ family response regulator